MVLELKLGEFDNERVLAIVDARVEHVAEPAHVFVDAVQQAVRNNGLVLRGAVPVLRARVTLLLARELGGGGLVARRGEV